MLWVDRVLWPYRKPVWSALGEQVELTVAVFSDREPNRPKFDIEDVRNVRVMHVPTRQTTAFASSENPLYVAKSSRALVEEVAPDVVVLSGWESPAHQQLRFWARRRGAAHVQFYGGTSVTHRFSTGPIATARRAYFRSADAVITYSKASRDEVRSFGVEDAGIFVGFNTVDVRKFAAMASSARAECPNEAAQGHTFVVVSQLIPRKNIGAAIEGFSKIAEPDDRFVVIGTGPLLESLRGQAERQGVGDRVSFLGFRPVDELVPLLVRSHTLVLPSLEEVWGLVVNEGLACGLHAVVSNRTGAAADVDGMHGVWVADPDPAALGQAMKASRSAWSGPIPDPAILDYTPQRYAEVARDAVMHALARRP